MDWRHGERGRTHVLVLLVYLDWCAAAAFRLTLSGLAARFAARVEVPCISFRLHACMRSADRQSAAKQ